MPLLKRDNYNDELIKVTPEAGVQKGSQKARSLKVQGSTQKYPPAAEGAPEEDEKGSEKKSPVGEAQERR